MPCGLDLEGKGAGGKKSSFVKDSHVAYPIEWVEEYSSLIKYNFIYIGPIGYVPWGLPRRRGGGGWGGSQEFCKIWSFYI